MSPRSHGANVTVWPWFSGEYKIYTEDALLAKQLRRWKHMRQHAIYHFPDGRISWDFIFPQRLLRRVCRLLGLPSPEKAPKRVAHGQRLALLGKHHRFPKEGSQLSQKGTKSTVVEMEKHPSETFPMGGPIPPKGGTRKGHLPKSTTAIFTQSGRTQKHPLLNLAGENEGVS